MTSKFESLKVMREQRALENREVQAAVQSEGLVHIDQAATAPRKVGRPPGKRSNPDYQQVTVLLHSATYTDVRKRLLDERKEVSELVNELMSAWLNR